MEFDLSVFEKQNEMNEIAREKYVRLVEKEKALKNRIGERRITQVKIAAQVGISDSMISFWLKKERELGIASVMKMLDTLLNEEALLNLRIESEVERLEGVRAGRRNHAGK